MRLLILSDIHGELENLEKLSEEFKTADLVLFGGDFTKFNEIETGLPTLKALTDKHDSIFAVTGNCDNPDLIEEMENADISIQKTLVFRDGLVFIGSGGALKFTGTTPNERTDEDLVSDFNIIFEQTQENSEPDLWRNLIVIMHQPPKNTNCDTISTGIHVGSELLRDFIEQIQPLLVVTGHIHEAASIDTIGKTLIINPGSLAEGNYGIIEITKQNEEWIITDSKLQNIATK